MANTLKAMSLNLVNSACLDLDIGDWHGLNSNTATLNYFQQTSRILSGAIEYMKKTIDPSSPGGKKLWDTTTIVLGSEFTRVDRAMGQDNGDGGSQGVMLIGGNIKGGFWGDCDVVGGNNPKISFYGIDAQTGAKINGRGDSALNTPEQIYNTINSLVGVDSSSNQVLKKIT